MKSRVIPTNNPYDKHRELLKSVEDYNKSNIEISELAVTLFQNIFLCDMGRMSTDGHAEWEYHEEQDKLFFNDSLHKELSRNLGTLYELRGYFMREADLGPDSQGSISAYPEVTQMWVSFLQVVPPQGFISQDYSRELSKIKYEVTQ